MEWTNDGSGAGGPISTFPQEYLTCWPTSPILLPLIAYSHPSCRFLELPVLSQDNLLWKMCFFHISQMIEWIYLKLSGNVSIIIMHLPINKIWSMDRWILRKTKNGWRWWRSISWKPCTWIYWNCLGMLSSSILISPWNKFLNGCMVFRLWKK